jgi:hypothetical protein
LGIETFVGIHCAIFLQVAASSSGIARLKITETEERILVTLVTENTISGGGLANNSLARIGVCADLGLRNGPASSRIAAVGLARSEGVIVWNWSSIARAGSRIASIDVTFVACRARVSPSLPNESLGSVVTNLSAAKFGRTNNINFVTDVVHASCSFALGGDAGGSVRANSSGIVAHANLAVSNRRASRIASVDATSTNNSSERSAVVGGEVAVCDRIAHSASCVALTTAGSSARIFRRLTYGSSELQEVRKSSCRGHSGGSELVDNIARFSWSQGIGKVGQKDDVVVNCRDHFNSKSFSVLDGIYDIGSSSVPSSGDQDYDLGGSSDTRGSHEVGSSLTDSASNVDIYVRLSASSCALASGNAKN